MRWVDWKRWAPESFSEITNTLTIWQLVKKYERGDLPKSDWLDSLAFRKMEEIHAVCTSLQTSNSWDLLQQAETEKSNNLFLYIDLPRFDFPVIFNEPEARSIPSTTSISSSPSNAPTAPPISSFTTDMHLWSIVDPEIARENPVEDKHRRLVRSHRSGPYDRELKPNAKIRDELAVCF